MNYMAELRALDKWKPVTVMLAIDLAFAILNVLLKKVLDGGVNNLVFITYRLSIATIFLVPIGYFGERDGRSKLTLRVLGYLFCSATVGSTLTLYFSLLGIQYTSATFACAFMNMVPVVTFLMALPFRLEKVNIKRKSGKAKLLGTLVCVGGAILLTLYRGIPLFNFSHSKAAAHTTDHFMKVSSSKRTERWIVGSLSLIAGMLLWSSWFVLQSNIGKLFPCQYSSTAIMSFFGAIQSAIFCLSKERNISIWVLKGKLEIVSVLYAGMVGSGLCYVGMSWCVKKRGPLFTAAFSPLIQILAAMFDIPILHEQLYLGSIFGSITVIIGLYMLLWGKNKEGDGSVNAEILVHETEEVKCQGPEFQTIEVGRDSQHPRT